MYQYKVQYVPVRISMEFVLLLQHHVITCNTNVIACMYMYM